MATYSHQMSAPAGAEGYFPGNYLPTRGPSHTLPGPGQYLYDVPDEAIIGTLPCQNVYEQGAKDTRTWTLNGQTVNLDMGSATDTLPVPSPAFEDLLYGDEEKKKEREVLKQNRARLTEYVHDCTVLFPYMLEKNVFNRTDCDKISHEITGIMKMNTFIDIVLTKGPQAIGVFHDSLDHHYPAVFDVLSGLFTNAGISLPKSRQKKERPEFDDEPSDNEDEITRTINNRGRRGREGVRTIRIRLKELSKHCAKVQSQRDELQSTLKTREQDIDALISRIDRQDAQNSDLMSKLQHWRQTLTDQSNGSIQQLGAIIQEKEMIQKEYTELAGELELTVSELMAARDRIGKLLVHLDRTDKQAAATVEAKDKLADKVLMQSGEIQKLLRKIDRLKADSSSPPSPDVLPADKRIEELEAKLDQLEKDCDLYQEQTAVACRERKHALEERDETLVKLHSQKSKNRRLRTKMKELQASVDMASLTSAVDSVNGAGARGQLEDTTIFMTNEDSTLELGLAVVVRGITEGSKAFQEGVRLGDEIREVNRVKVTADTCEDPLAFARQILTSVSQHVVNLTVRRPVDQSASVLDTFGLRSPLDINKRLLKVSDMGTHRKGTKLVSAKSSSTSTRSHDTTSGDDTRDSDSLSDQSSGDEPYNRNSFSQIFTDNSGIIDSPRSSRIDWLVGSNHTQATVNGLEFGGNTSENVPLESDHGYNSLPYDRLIRKPGIRKNKRDKAKLSQSLDDLDKFKFPSDSPVMDDISPKMKSLVRQVILRKEKWGDDFTITGGRGNGLFVESNSDIRGLNTGDQILQIGDYPAKNLTYAEALELISDLSDGYYFMLVAENKSAYDEVQSSATPRDNFFVRARYYHSHRNRSDFGLEYHKGDVFHVTDSKPKGNNGFWRVERVKGSTGDHSKGFIPITLDYPMAEGSSSMPVRGLHSPKIPQRSTSSYFKAVSTRRAYEFYEAVHKVVIRQPRPVVLLGACENEVRQGLVEQGVIQGIKFAFCLRELSEKLDSISSDLIVETVVSNGEVMKSTVDNVKGAANQGYHCVLCLRNDELIKPGVTSLHPITLLLTPRRGFKTFRDPQSSSVGRTPIVDQEYINRLKKKYSNLISGEITLSSGMSLDDALRTVRETVARKQEEAVWEAEI